MQEGDAVRYIAHANRPAYLYLIYIDSTGVGIIVMSAGQLKQAGGALRVCAQGHIEGVLKMTNIDKVVGLHPTMAAAAAGF